MVESWIVEVDKKLKEVGLRYIGKEKHGREFLERPATILIAGIKPSDFLRILKESVLSTTLKDLQSLIRPFSPNTRIL